MSLAFGQNKSNVQGNKAQFYELKNTFKLINTRGEEGKYELDVVESIHNGGDSENQLPYVFTVASEGFLFYQPDNKYSIFSTYSEGQSETDYISWQGGSTCVKTFDEYLSFFKGERASFKRAEQMELKVLNKEVRLARFTSSDGKKLLDAMEKDLDEFFELISPKAMGTQLYPRVMHTNYGLSSRDDAQKLKVTELLPVFRLTNALMLANWHIDNTKVNPRLVHLQKLLSVCRKIQFHDFLHIYGSGLSEAESKAYETAVTLTQGFFSDKVGNTPGAYYTKLMCNGEEFTASRGIFSFDRFEGFGRFVDVPVKFSKRTGGNSLFYVDLAMLLENTL